MGFLFASVLLGHLSLELRVQFAVILIQLFNLILEDLHLLALLIKAFCHGLHFGLFVGTNTLHLGSDGGLTFLELLVLLFQINEAVAKPVDLPFIFALARFTSFGGLDDLSQLLVLHNLEQEV